MPAGAARHPGCLSPPTAPWPRPMICGPRVMSYYERPRHGRRAVSSPPPPCLADRRGPARRRPATLRRDRARRRAAPAVAQRCRPVARHQCAVTLGASFTRGATAAGAPAWRPRREMERGGIGRLGEVGLPREKQVGVDERQDLISKHRGPALAGAGPQTNGVTPA